ncbi:hypothetical protein T11_12246 [Trichinella zimbabwensis]|uniref:Uncharacterized protein n=1 Tax=Trichinella zimbabwensis TaxID=268475 RepID=A0A0V1HCY7_9BILA|nr:hypothetical protein T11_12246 [Trichinella zimbabwensis]
MILLLIEEYFGRTLASEEHFIYVYYSYSYQLDIAIQLEKRFQLSQLSATQIRFYGGLFVIEQYQIALPIP